MDAANVRRFARFCGLTTVAALLSACAAVPPLAATRNQIIVSVRDQKLTVVRDDHTRVSFPISTSKFGLGDRRGTYETPTGELAVAEKIGGGARPGSVFHGRVRTGEIVKVDAPGRDAIVTRILALRGLESNNKGAFSRGIYIHGTPEERNIGRPTSYGCIRMRSKDVIALYDMVRVGARVQIIDTTQSQAIAANIIREPEAAGTASVANAASNAPPAALTTTIVTEKTRPSIQPPTGSAAATALTKPAQPAGKPAWAGAPQALLAKQAAAEQKAKAKPPVGAPANAQPVANPSNGNQSNGLLNRSAMDSL